MGTAAPARTCAQYLKTIAFAIGTLERLGGDEIKSSIPKKFQEEK